MKRVAWVVLLFAPAAFAAGGVCELVKPDEAAAILGGPVSSIPVGTLGCSYGNRARGLRLTVTVMAAGTMARQTWEGMRSSASSAKWLAGDERGMGTAAYAQLIRRNSESSAGKCGFVAIKGGKLVQMFISDSAEKEDVAGKKEMLDRFRPLAHKIVERLP